MDNIRVLMDRLEQQSRARRAAASTPGQTPAPAPAIPGLRYQPGARVLELVSGRKGTIRAGARDDATGVQVYELELVTGETVYRTIAELGTDVAPRSPANR
jgi:hypothetical protein